MSGKWGYIFFAVFIVLAVAGILGREFEHRARIKALNAEIFSLSEKIEAKDTQILDLSTRIKAAQAEAEAVSIYSKRAEAIREAGETVENAIFETVQKDDEARSWCDLPVPCAIRDILYSYSGGGKD